MKGLRPSLIMPPIRIGGIAAFKPPLLAHVQVDGSFGRRRQAAVAVKFVAAAHDRSASFTKPVYAVESSTEAEWIAVYTGLMFALENNEKAMVIENDCLGVIHHLMQREMALRRDYAQHWRSEIYKLAEQTEWTGVRWIPRRQNRADDLF
jgi:hypothetical protein